MGGGNRGLVTLTSRRVWIDEGGFGRSILSRHLRVSHSSRSLFLLVVLLLLSRPAVAQVSPLLSSEVVLDIDSGLRYADVAGAVDVAKVSGARISVARVFGVGASAEDSSPVASGVVVFSTEVVSDGALWLRLSFGDVVLAGDGASGGSGATGSGGAYVRITAHEDGASQLLDARGLAEWGHTSAYFNGDGVTVELIAPPGTGPSRLEIVSVTVGEGNPGAATLCGADDRVLSDDPRVARLLPVSCTGFLVGDHPHCFLTAGHCVVFGSIEVAEFNVPLSDASGNNLHPDPIDQYPIDQDSIQFAFEGQGRDWCTFGAFRNGESGLPPAIAQEAAYVVADEVPVPDGGVLRVTGHGADNTPMTYNGVQQTASGTYDDFSGTTIRYDDIDTQGGNSGSPVFHEPSGLAIGIHTNGGCGAVGGSNSGTAINNEAFRYALSHPEGICRPFEDCNGNFTPDDLDIGSGASGDLNANSIPDECDQVGDVSGDGDADLFDFAVFEGCVADVESDEACLLFDVNGDGVIDLIDFAGVQRGFTGDCGLTIVGQPVDVFMCEGGVAAFGVEVEGVSAGYQWQLDGVDIVGATESMLVVDPVTPAVEGEYRVRVTSGCAERVSEVVSLVVTGGPVITGQPSPLVVCPGESASFGVLADGTKPLSYQWLRDGVELAGETGDVISLDGITVDDAGAYACVVSDQCGNDTTSDAATLGVASVEFTKQPVGADVCTGEPLFLTAIASNQPVYQWFRDGMAIKGAVEFFLFLPAVSADDAGVYHVEATGVCNVAASDGAVVTVTDCGP